MYDILTSRPGRTSPPRAVGICGLLLAVTLAVGAAGADDEPTVDGRVGLGAMGGYANPGAHPMGSYDARAMLDLRLNADNLGSKPVGIAADGDLFFDIDDLVFRTYRMTDLNVHFRPKAGKLTIVVGRQRVADTTEELVDGVGMRADLGKGFHLGGYGGLIPDPFTTLASVETGGGGAVFGFWAPRFRFETATGFSARSVGFDHGYASLSAMGMPVPAVSMYGRAKMQGFSGTPAFGVADLFAGLSLKPARILRIRALYNGYSSERYVDLVDRDPVLSRFAARAEGLDLLDEVPNDSLDTALYHQLGADVDLRNGERHGAVGVRGRFRLTPDADNRYVRADLHGGLVQLGQGGADLIATGRYIHASGRHIGQAELGLETPMFQRKVDLGAYLMFSGSPAISGENWHTIGVYGDLFVSLWLGKGWSVAAAARVGWEDNPAASAVIVDGLLKVTNRFRGKPGRKASVSSRRQATTDGDGAQTRGFAGHWRDR